MVGDLEKGQSFMQSRMADPAQNNRSAAQSLSNPDGPLESFGETPHLASGGGGSNLFVSQ